MILKAELTGNRLKKDLELQRALYRWHNKNKSGGNFGINLITGGQQNYEITGHYNTNGEITSLRFGRIYSAGVPVPKDYTYEQLISVIKRGLAA